MARRSSAARRFAPSSEEFAAHVGVRHALGVANGTDALELALQALDVGPAMPCSLVPFTFAATARSHRALRGDAGARRHRRGLHAIDVDAAAALMQRRPVKAIIAVHLYGHPADLDRLAPLAQAHGAALIEDAAQAHGAWCTAGGQRRRAGSVGDIGCFSFYPTQNLGAMGDAGAVVSNRDDLAARVRLLANHGERVKYEHAIANGRNSRLDALQAAVLRVKLPHLDAWNAARRASLRRSTTRRLPVCRCSCRASAAARNACTINTSCDGGALAAAARAGRARHRHGRALPGWRCTSRRAFATPATRAAVSPMAERFATEVLSLPMSPFLSQAESTYVTDSIRDILGKQISSGL